MKKFVCSVCGYVYEGEAAPAECPDLPRTGREVQGAGWRKDLGC